LRLSLLLTFDPSPFPSSRAHLFSFVFFLPPPFRFFPPPPPTASTLHLHSYTPALASLSHTLILAPQNPLHYLRHAETAYTLGDLPLAFKSYLLCLSLTERVKDGSEGQGKGLAVRAWWGVKLVSERKPERMKRTSGNEERRVSLADWLSPFTLLLLLPSFLPSPFLSFASLSQTTRSLLSSSSSNPKTSDSGVPRPPQKEIEEFSVLATKWLVKIYSGKKGVDRDSKKALVDGFLKQ